MLGWFRRRPETLTLETDRSAVSLQALVDLFASSSLEAMGHASATHAGVAAVLEALSEAAQRQAARQVERYDHRSLYEFAAAMHREASAPTRNATATLREPGEALAVHRPALSPE